MGTGIHGLRLFSALNGHLGQAPTVDVVAPKCRKTVTTWKIENKYYGKIDALHDSDHIKKAMIVIHARIRHFRRIKILLGQSAFRLDTNI